MSEFTWVPFYGELADKLVPYRSRQPELIEYLNGLRGSVPITPFVDRDAAGREFPLEEIDPFTFFAVFNRRITDANRFQILAALRGRFGVTAPVPTDVTGIPVLHPMNSWFFGYKKDRDPKTIPHLWELFAEARKPEPWRSTFKEAFDHVVDTVSPGQVTIGLYWIRPEVFLPLDRRTRAHLALDVNIKELEATEYQTIVQSTLRSNHRTPFEISRDAWTQTTAPTPDTPCWLVGAWWDDADPQDRTADFVRDGVWKNGYADKYLDEVRQMRPGDRIAIKAATTQKSGLPFEYPKTVSKMVIKARGIVTGNAGDGREVQVEWDQDFEPRDWYFYTYRATVWKLDTEAEYGALLADFIFEGKPQDFPFFVSRWQEMPPEPLPGGDSPQTYSREEAARGLFIDQSDFDALVDLFEEKRNLILQGAPGVGKTFLAKRLAYALLGTKDDERVQAVQFHQSYSYEDFVQGFRPSLGEAGALAFVLRDGIFYEFCMRARKSSEPHVFIIDEINRGNVSRIFGELMSLLEADKRGEKHAMRLAYQQPGDPRFYVPENLYVLGLMNVADRSLAVVDYALRRRFGFYDLQPQFGSPRHRSWMAERGISLALTGRIVDRLQALNKEIAADPQLGPHFAIGHSYFCPQYDGQKCDDGWFRRVVATQIGPLLREYWYDDVNKADQAIDALLTD